MRILGFIGLGAFLLWIAFRKTDFSILADDLKNANYTWVIIALLFGFVAFVSRARRWMLLINSLGYRPSMSETYHAVMTGYLANLALPRLGELTRCVALGKKKNIPVDQLFGTVLAERAFDLVTLVAITFIVLLTSSSQIADYMNKSIFLPAREKVAFLFGATWVTWLILVIVAAASLTLLIKYRRGLRKIKIFGKFFDVAKGIINGLKAITSLERKGEFILHTLLIWFSYGMMTWVVVFSLESTSGISFAEAMFLLVVGGLAMSVPVQGGFGVFHYAVSRAIVILENVSMEDGLAYAVLAHESQLVWIAIAGSISFFLLSRKSHST